MLRRNTAQRRSPSSTPLNSPRGHRSQSIWSPWWWERSSLRTTSPGRSWACVRWHLQYISHVHINLIYFSGFDPQCTSPQSRRGIQKNMFYIDDHRVIMKYIFPLNEIVVDFYDQLKSMSSGYARWAVVFHLTQSRMGLIGQWKDTHKSKISHLYLFVF